MLQLFREQSHKSVISLPLTFSTIYVASRSSWKNLMGLPCMMLGLLQPTYFLDASLTGLGGAFNKLVYTVTLPKGSCLLLVGSLQYTTLANCMCWFPLPFQLPVVIWPVQCWKSRKTPNKYINTLPKNYIGYDIAQLEILNIVVALKVWGKAWRDRRFRIYCDKRAVVDTLTSGRARDTVLATCARNIWLLAAMFNITIVTSHVYGVNNSVADLLSRWPNTADNMWKLHQYIPNTIWVDTHLDLTLFDHTI